MPDFSSRYARRGGLGRNLGLPPIVIGLIAATVVTTITSWIAARNGVPFLEYLMFRPADVWAGQVWRLVTSAFVAGTPDNGGPINLIFSCLLLYWFGRDLAARWGAKGFLVTWFSVVIVANACTCVVGLVWPEVMRFPYIGGWPVEEAMMLAWATTFADREVLVMLVVPASGRVLVYVTLGLVLLWTAYLGLAATTPHYFALLAIAVWTGMIVPRRLYRDVQSRFTRNRRRARPTHLHAIPGGQDKPREGKSPQYWN